MTPVNVIPDDIIEAIVADRPVEPPYACLVGIADDVRALGNGPAPGPSAELAALLRGSGGGEAGTSSVAEGMPTVVVAPRRFSLAAKVAGLGIVAKVALGTSVAAAGVIGAGAAGVLPEGVDDVVRSAVDAISPFDLEGGSTEGPASHPDTGGAGNPGDPGDAGTGADGADDGRNGATDAEGDSGVDEPPGQTGDTGLTRANETPAAPHAPDTTPGPPTTVDRPTPSSTVPPARPDDPGRGTLPTVASGTTAVTADD